jgi:hypothetical protein
MASNSDNCVGFIRDKLRIIRQIREEITHINRLAAKLDTLQERYNSAVKDVLGALDKLDVSANGNFGWDARVIAFLSELDRQAIRAGIDGGD